MSLHPTHNESRKTEGVEMKEQNRTEQNAIDEYDTTSINLLVRRSANVLSSVLRLDRRNVEHDEAKVGNGFNSVGLLKRLSVVEPLDFEVWVSDRHQRAFKVSRLVVSHPEHVFELRRELGTLAVVSRHATKGDRYFVLAPLVGGTTTVLARVVDCCPEDLEDDHSESVNGADAVTSLQRLLVIEPLNDHCLVASRSQRCLEVSQFSFGQIRQVLKL